MSKEKELAITKTFDLAKPTEVMEMATVLKTYIVKQGLYTVISDKNFAHVDGWQFAGFLSGLSAIVDEPKDLSTDKEIKWSCSAKLYSKEKLVGVGYALCSNKESKKKSFDEYAVLSMAQTRAIGKAYRNKIGWVMKLAGYQSTPSEEMQKVGETPQDPQQPITTVEAKVVPKKTQVCYECDAPVGDKGAEISKNVYKKVLCREHFNEKKNSKK